MGGREKMSDFTHHSDLSRELRTELRAAPEPLLAVEKKLIGWSLGIGLTLLAVLAAISHVFPAGS
jgi:hypothetical protein